MKILFSIALVLLALLLSPFSRAGIEWPIIEGVERQFDIWFDADRIDIEVPIRDQSGAIVYSLVCRGGDYDEYLATLIGIESAEYLPPLTCVLYEGRGFDGGSLLSEDRSRASYSRGYVSHHSLLGSCAEYPQFGVLRKFRLRAMEIVLKFSEIESLLDEMTGEQKISRAKLSLSASPDNTAETAIAERSGYLSPDRPQGSCSEVTEGQLPMMCRDAESLELLECPAGWEYEN